MSARDLMKAADALSMAYIQPNANKSNIKKVADDLRKHSQDIIQNEYFWRY